MIDFDQKANSWDSDISKIERAHKVAQGIKNRISLSNKMSAFEYGCGTGLLSFALQPYLGSITLADSSDGMLAVLKAKIAAGNIKNMKPIKLDLIKDEAPKAKYSIIYTLMTLHHVLEINRLIKQFYQLLHSDGYLCIADLDEEDGSFHGDDFLGHKGFNRQKLMTMLMDCGYHEIDFQDICSITKQTGNAKKEFSVFLLIAKKPHS